MIVVYWQEQCHRAIKPFMRGHTCMWSILRKRDYPRTYRNFMNVRSYFRFWLIYSSTTGTTKTSKIPLFHILRTRVRMNFVCTLWNHKRSKPGGARPSRAIRGEVYSSSSSCKSSITAKHSRHKQNKLYEVMFKFPLYLDEASGKKCTAVSNCKAAGEQSRGGTKDVQSRGIRKRYVFSSRRSSIPCW